MTIKIGDIYIPDSCIRRIFVEDKHLVFITTDGIRIEGRNAEIINSK